ncbi:Molybdopterin molybdenumtransferase [Novipirellula aureliae]|uniref:Molybdopterin molybdenumtransferase n=1 Tax=Novipirellula aureliae TaxID=2527966 RepID=A0A5C6E7J1_9BACT|nr:molybdopterin molybdotransferase MoeA [Novipirellula aureliae]TWU45613.1 Molybdopterin molybdenumtransferase [Novipirellula aureliae]
MTDFNHPNRAIDALAERLLRRETHQLESDQLVGRVLASDVLADRDSPAADVSAMDGYAIRLSDFGSRSAVPIAGECVAGEAPPPMIPNAVLRIFTGAVVPDGCEAVVKREDTIEHEHSIEFLSSARNASPGEHIRRAGENAKTNDCVLAAGSLVTPASIATMVNFGSYSANVFDQVRVSLITTGNEVDRFEQESPRPWQLRNSNAAAIESMLRSIASVRFIDHHHCRDDRFSLAESLEKCLSESDAVFLTGGVSQGDYDYVPKIIPGFGAEIVFHGLPIRPGKPILGAATRAGKLILGLPGNPVSATVGARRFARPLLAKMSGQNDWREHPPQVRLHDSASKSLPLHVMRLVRHVENSFEQGKENAVVAAVPSLGSGDLVSLGQSIGFVEIPPGHSGEGPWPFFAW